MSDFKKQQEFRQRVLELRMAITESIDKICVSNNYEVSYLEINTALIDVLESNYGYELKETLKDA